MSCLEEMEPVTDPSPVALWEGGLHLHGVVTYPSESSCSVNAAADVKVGIAIGPE